MIRKLSITILLLLSMSACSDTTQKTEKSKGSETLKEAETQSVLKESKTSIENPMPVLSDTKKEKILKKLKEIKNDNNKNLNQARSVSINGEKFRTTTWPVIKGSTVYNVLMKEKGRIKGTFVVVLTEGKALSASINDSFTINKIAKNTFNLLPNNRKILDMMQEYKRLLQEGFHIVEMEVDYSPIDTNQEF